MNQTMAIDEDIKLDYFEKYFAALNFSSSESNKILTITLPFLNLAIKLRNLFVVANGAKLKKALVYQVEAVCDSVQRASYGDAIVVATQYALCAFVDECIVSTTWGQELEWDKDGLLKHFTGESGGDKKFFATVKELYTEPHKNIDVLELFYVCLSLGFANKYRQHKKGQLVVKEITDDLYECITRYRKTKDSNALVVKPSDMFGGVVADAKVTPPRKFFAARTLWIFGLIVILSLVMYGSFNIHLNNMLKPIYKTAIGLNDNTVANTGMNS